MSEDVINSARLEKAILLLSELGIKKWGWLNSYRIEAIKKYSGYSVLDVGCASGIYIDYLLENGYDAYGVDLLLPAFNNGAQGKKITNGNAIALPFKDKSFDTVICFETLEHIQNIDSTLAEFRRVARKNILLTVPNCEIPKPIFSSSFTYIHWVDISHVQHFNQNSFEQKLIESGLQPILLTKINPASPENLFIDWLRLPEWMGQLIRKIIKVYPVRKYYFTLLAVVTPGPGTQ